MLRIPTCHNFHLIWFCNKKQQWIRAKIIIKNENIFNFGGEIAYSHNTEIASDALMFSEPKSVISPNKVPPPGFFGRHLA